MESSLILKSEIYILRSIYSWSKCLNSPCFDLLFNQSELEFISSVKHSAAVSLNTKKYLFLETTGKLKTYTQKWKIPLILFKGWIVK